MLGHALQVFRDKDIVRPDTDIKYVTFFINGVIQQVLAGELSVPGYDKKQMIVNFLRTYFRGMATNKALSEMQQLANS